MARRVKRYGGYRRYRGRSRRRAGFSGYRRRYVGGSRYRRFSRRGYIPAAPSRQLAVTDLPKFYRAQVDPFSREGLGVRVPDDNTAPSSAVLAYDNVTMTVPGNTAQGMAFAYVFNPSLLSMCNSSKIYSSAGSGAASTFAWNTDFTNGRTSSSKYTAITNSFNLSRPVAHGIRLSCAGASTSVQGFVHVCILPLDVSGATGYSTCVGIPLSFSDMASSPSYRKFTLASLTQNPVCVVNKYMDQTAFRYTDTSATEIRASNDFVVPNSWCSIFVAVEQHNLAAGAAVMDVESVCHYEMTSKPQSVNPDMPAEPANRKLFDATSVAVSRVGGAYVEGTTDQEMYDRKCLAEFVRVYGMPAGYTLGSAVGGHDKGGIPGVNNAERLR